jgi:hypothetical protein
MSNVKNTADLRNLLLEAIEGVRKGKVDHRQAQAISALSSRILQSARLDFDVMKLTMDTQQIGAPKSVSLVTKEPKILGRPKKVA